MANIPIYPGSSSFFPGNTTNVGVRYINQMPNGISKNKTTAIPQACFGIEDGFLTDTLLR